MMVILDNYRKPTPFDLLLQQSFTDHQDDAYLLHGRIGGKYGHIVASTILCHTLCKSGFSNSIQLYWTIKKAKMPPT